MRGGGWVGGAGALPAFQSSSKKTCLALNTHSSSLPSPKQPLTTPSPERGGHGGKEPSVAAVTQESLCVCARGRQPPPAHRQHEGRGHGHPPVPRWLSPDDAGLLGPWPQPPQASPQVLMLLWQLSTEQRSPQRQGKGWGGAEGNEQGAPLEPARPKWDSLLSQEDNPGPPPHDRS